MPRGFIWGAYFDNQAVIWRLRVDADSAEQLERGWVPANPGETAPFPRSWLPRKVAGVDDTGRLHTIVVASVLADLWTGAATHFTIEGSDGLPHQCAVIRLLGERRN
jgi:hypothetical protein